MLVLAAAAAGPAAAAPSADGIARAHASGRLSDAEYALERALALFRPERARRLFGSVARPDPRDASPALRDLAARSGGLPPALRAEAARVLARPTDRADAIHAYRFPARRVCDAHMCFHWVSKSADAPSLANRNGNAVPDWVDRTRAIFATVWRTEVGRFGYRAPLSDSAAKNHGPDGKLDIYVADLGRHGLYGYCTTDDPARGRRRSVSAYCVVDDDFSPRQFPSGATGLRALRVTAAHEFFHAVQYSYDWLEDLWLMEGTATWIEDEVFDSVDDNRQYLRTSPLGREAPYLPLDHYNTDPRESDAGYKYGVWIFWRYLAERFGRDIVRDVWTLADSRGHAPDQYSLQATATALAIRRETLPAVLADFGVANVAPANAYSEGTAYSAPRPSGEFTVGLSGVTRTRIPMYHLSNDMWTFKPAPGLASAANLALTLDLPPTGTGVATAVVQEADGSVLRVAATRNEATGRYEIALPAFGRVSGVTLVLTNGGSRYRCWQRAVYSCRGRPLDDADFFFEGAVTVPVPPAPPPPALP